MNNTSNVILGVILSVGIAVGLSALVAWLLAFGLAYSFGYDLGFMRTWVGMFTIGIVSIIAFIGIRIEFGGE